MAQPQQPDWETLPAMLTIREVQGILGLSRATTDKVIHRAGFPLIRLGPKLFRVHRTLFQAWLDREAVAGREARG